MSNIIYFPQKAQYDDLINRVLDNTRAALAISDCPSKLIEMVMDKIKPESEKIITDILSAGLKEVELKGVSGFTDEHQQQICNMFHPQIGKALGTVNILLAREAIRDIVNSKE